MKYYEKMVLIFCYITLALNFILVGYIVLMIGGIL